jgi:hypothetical protein
VFDERAEAKRGVVLLVVLARQRDVADGRADGGLGQERRRAEEILG